MEELIEKVDNLIHSLQESPEIKDLKEVKERVEKDSSLLEDIKKYNETQEEQLKEKIIHNPLFREYKHKETECNFLIMEINQKLKEITKEKKGCHENH